MAGACPPGGTPALIGPGNELAPWPTPGITPQAAPAEGRRGREGAGDGAASGQRHGRVPRLLVEGWDVCGRLVHLDGVGTGEAAVGRHGQGDAVVLEVAEAGVDPHRIEVAGVAV